jgi:signal transduction histidine kinase
VPGPGAPAFAWLWGQPRRRDLALPAAVCAAQLLGALLLNWHHRHLDAFGPGDWALLLVGPVALTFRREHPVGALCVAFAVTLGPTTPGYLSLIVAFFVAAVRGHRRAAWASIAGGFVWSVWLSPLAYGKKGASVNSALVLGAWLLVLVIAAEAVRMAQERRAEAQAAREIEAKRRASEERLSMARDLHDVIGHNISLINVQAGVGLDLMDAQPEQARVALAAIKAVSKEALGELRAMLDALRQAGEEAPRAPAPGLSRLGELVALTQSAGMAVSTKLEGSVRELPPAVEVAAYRIVQESLTNVARHAPGANVTVRLVYEEASLALKIVDEGSPGRLDANPATGTGSGVAGMRERARALGGDLTAAPRQGGGFVVEARIPVTSSE